MATKQSKFNNGHMEPIYVIKDAILCLCRSGAQDAEECVHIAKRALMDMFKLTQRQADNLWEQFAPKNSNVIA